MDGGSEPVDFETLFKLRLSDKLDTLFANEKDLPTQFVLVPSLRDVFHEFVYPQVHVYYYTRSSMYILLSPLGLFSLLALF